jgi:hypothetical protein
MDETPRTQPERTTGINRMRPTGLMWAVLAIVIAFFIGFFWQFYQATTVRATLRGTEQELVVERLRVQLANAAIAAQTGQYETARRQMSDFFNRIQAQQWALPDRLRTVSNEFLAMRDDVITGLSRGNPEYAGVLFGMLDRYEEAVPAQGPPPPQETEPAQQAPPAGGAQPAQPTEPGAPPEEGAT